VKDAGLQLGLFSAQDLGDAPKQRAPTETRIVQDDAGFAALLQSLERASRIAFDTETTGLDMVSCELVGMSFCANEGEGWYVPVNVQANGAWTLKPQSQPARDLIALLNRSSAELVAHNAKFDLGVLKQHSLPITHDVYDTLIAEFAINPFKRGGYGLKALAKQHLGWDMTEIDELIGHGAQHVSMRDVPVELAAPYAAADADATWRLCERQAPQIESLKLHRLLNEVEFPLLPVLVDMELAGVAIDQPFLKTMSDEMAARLQQIEQNIFNLTGRPFNVGSPQQLSAVLYRELGLQVNFGDIDALQASDRVPSTRGYRLEELRDKHPIIPLVLEHREISKLKGTYVDALPALVNPRTGRVHTHFNQAVVVTGRLSSSNPNLQNVPITTEMGRRVRQAFIAREGAQVLSADYSQIELRVLAHMAGDAGLRAAFERGEDIHAATAAAIYHVPIEQVTPAQRGFAKRINFGIAYGMSSFSLARGTGMTDAQAEQFMRDYFRRFNGVSRWLNLTKQQMMRDHFVETMWGRRREFEDMRGKERKDIRRAERLAVNHPIQGTAAEIVKLAMIKLHSALKAGGFHSLLTLQVHDELVLDVPDAEVADVQELLQREMEHAVDFFTVPLKAEVGAGSNWNDVA
jgi:DNA polymerase-1